MHVSVTKDVHFWMLCENLKGVTHCVRDAVFQLFALGILTELPAESCLAALLRNLCY
jgi:hypothetical protein